MDDETILAQANDMIRQQQAVGRTSSASVKPVGSIAGGIAGRLDKLGVDEKSAGEQREREQKARQKLIAATEQRQKLARLVGKRYAGATLDGFEVRDDAQRDVVKHVRDYANGVEQRIADGSGLFLIGPPGTGKDHLVVSVLMVAAAKGIHVHWVDGMGLFAAARDNIDANKTEAAWMATYTSPTLLAISDPVPPLGSVKEGFQLATLFSIIDRRYRDMKPTLMTLNAASREEAESRMSPNIVDRLAHGALVLRCNWPSYRN